MTRNFWASQWMLGAALAAAFLAVPARTQETLCAVVKLEIPQEATLERQAFDARLVLKNNQSDKSLQDLRIDIVVNDSTGTNAGQLFFVKIISLENTSSVGGTGTVEPSTSAVVHWQIIPSPGSGGTNPLGGRYGVKANISYRIDADSFTLTTFESNLTVKPQPLLKLEYVLPFEVFGDEPLTDTKIEPIEPFPLGVRVTNVGYGPAKNFTIESAQPKIVENKLGLAVAFNLLGTVVSGKTVPNTLLIPFGDIAAGGVTQASWIMSTTLSGRFIEFTSTFTHAAELGGQLTSLIDSATTYTLVHDVLVQLPGRDATPDFLVNTFTPRGAIEGLLSGGGELIPNLILESDQAAPIPVVHVPVTLTGTLGGAATSLKIGFNDAVGAGIWVHASAPVTSGALSLISAQRADGVFISTRNVWIAKHFDKDTKLVTYRLNLLDLTSGATEYVLNFDPSAVDKAPGAVLDLVATAGSGGGELALAWNAPGEDDYTGSILGGRYLVQTSIYPDAVFAPGSAQVNLATSTSPGEPQSLLLTGLVGNATHYTRLWTQDTGGAISLESNGTTAYVLPNPPKDLVLTSVSSVSAHAAWQAGNNSLPLEYRVYAATAADGVAVSSSPYLDSFNREFDFAGLAPSTTYTVFGVARSSVTTAMSPLATLGQFMTAAASDTTPPFTSLQVNGITVATASVVVISTDALSFVATDTGTGVAQTLYALDGGTETVFVSTFSLAFGTHTLAYRSVDRAGNYEALQQSSVTTSAAMYLAASGDGAATISSPRADATITTVSTNTAAAAYAVAVASQGLVLMTPSLYELSPSPLVFDPPALLSLRFAPVGVDTATVAIYRFNGVVWDSAPVAGQQIAAIGGGLLDISGTLQSASLYAVFSLPAVPTLASIAVTPSTASIAAGTTAQFTAAGTFTDGSTRTLTGEVLWSTDVSSVATVNASGLATGVVVGTASVIASSGAITAQAFLTVTAPLLVSIAVTPSTASIPAGTAAQFEAAGTFTDGSTRTLTGEVMWSTDVSSVATVSPTGLALGAAAGAAHVIASSGSIAGRASVTVPVTLASIAVSPASTSALIGSAVQFAAVGTFTDGSTRAFTSGAGLWQSKAPMGTARAGAAGAFADGKFFVFGGVLTTSVEAYDPLADAWTARAPQPVNRTYAQAAELNGKIYVVGGAVNADGNSATGALWMYDPAANTWTAKAPMPTPRFTLSFEALNGKLYATGGLVSGYAPTSTLEVYDPATNTWQTKASLPQARGHVAGGVIGGKLYVAGGSPTTAELQIYDPAANTWTPGAPQPLAREAQKGAVLDGRLYVMGGLSAAATAADGKRTFVYDAAANAWSEGPLLSAARYMPATAAGAGKIFAAGSLFGNQNTTSLEMLAPQSEVVWSVDAPSVATVTASGLATGLTAGAAHVIASSGAIAGQASLTVTSPVLTALAVTPATALILAGATAQFAAAGTFSDGSTRTLTGEVVWSTDVSSVATVSSTGLALGAAAGAARVIASSGAITGQASLTVPVTLASIAVSPASTSALIGTAVQFAAVGTFTDGSTRTLVSSAGVWLTKAPMNTARTGAAGAFADGKFFVFGGVLLTSVEAYDPLADAWTVRAPQPVNRSYAQAAELNGKIYVVGGCVNADCGAVTNALWMYDPAANTWTAKMSMPTARFVLSFEAINGKLYAAGGLVPGYSATSAMEVYDPATNTWQTKASMPLARGMTAGGVVGGKLLVAGGGAASTLKAAELQIYDPAANTWASGAPQPLARQHQKGAVLNGRFHVMGGLSAASTEADGKRTFIYDAATDAWSEGPLMNVGRYGPATASGGMKIYAAGSTIGNLSTTSLETLAPASEVAWSVDAPSVATVTPSGLATGLSAGAAHVIALSGEITGQASLTVTAPVLTTLTVTPSTAAIEAGAAAQFAAAGTFSDGSTRILTGEVAWTTDVSSVAEVSASGLATGVDGGTAHVIASSGAIAGQATLTVTLPPLTVSSISPDSAETGASVLAAVVGTGFNASAALSLERSDALRGTWRTTGSFAQGRYLGTLTKLRDGRVLLAGGITGATTVGAAAVDLYDPATGLWTAGPPLNQGRNQYAAIRLADGRVLVAGGYGPGTLLNSVEIYDPALNAWTTAAPMASARVWHHLALLSDGRVLAAGGADGSGYLSSAEIYNPSTNMWSPAATMSAGHAGAAGATLSDGKVLIAGGFGPSATAEVYNPATNAWTSAGSMSEGRSTPGSVLLPSGKVLVTGGSSGGTADVYDPATNAWTATGAMTVPRNIHALVLVNGTPLVIDGENSSAGLASTEIYDAATNVWRPGPALTAPRTWTMAATLDDGRVLAAGGLLSVGGATLNTAELLGGAAASIAATGVTVTNGHHLTGTLALTGAATGYWDVVVREAGGRIGRFNDGFQILPRAPTLSAIAVTPSTAEIEAGGTAQFAAAGTFSDGSTRTLTGEVAWMADVSSVATVSISGLATGLTPGTAHVIASSGAVSGQAALTVKAPPPTVASISPASAATGEIFSAAVVGTNFDASAALSLERVSDVLRGTWTATGSFTQGRFLATLTKLRDGRVLLAGGSGGDTATGLAAVDLYDQATQLWTAGPPLNQGRNQYSAVRLADGRVLVAGGYGPGAPLKSVEIFDPALNTWTTVAPMGTVRVWFQLAVLSDGRVLAAGGHNGVGYLSSAEIYNPSTNIWSPAASMSEGRAAAAGATLSDGKVLIAGGFGPSATAEVYNPATNVWTPAGSMSEGRSTPGSALLPNGKVLVTGGSSGGTADVYDPATNAWTATGAMTVPRNVHALVLVNGTALVIDGENSSAGLASTEIFDAATNAWRPGPALTAPRTWTQAVTLNDGRVLAAGGLQGVGGSVLNTAELLGGAAASIAATGVTATDAQHLTGTFALTNAALGPWDVVVRETDGRLGRLSGGFLVLPPTLASLAVTPSTSSILAGATAQFAAAGTFTDGSTRTLTGEVAWSTDILTVATVSVTGLATGLGGGTAHVIASSGAIAGRATLNVAYVATSTVTVGGAPELTLVSTAPFSVVIVSTEAGAGAVALASAAAQGMILISAVYDVTRQDPGATATLTWFFDPALVDAATLAIWRFDGISWSSVTVLNQVVSVAGGVGTVTGDVVRTSLYALFSITVTNPSGDSAPPLVRLDFPGASALGVERAVGGVVSVRGSAADASALTWILKAGLTVLASGTGNVTGTLAAWDTAALSGPQTLTLSAVDTYGNAASTSAQVFVGAPVMTFSVGRKDADAIVTTIKGPTGIAVRSDGAVWVASTENDQILLISPAGILLGAAGQAPGHSGEDKESGKKDKENEHGNSAGLSFKSPQGLALDAADQLYVADRDLDRVVKLSPDGHVLLLKIGKPGSGPGELKRPFDAAVDVNGDVYVADSGNRRISVFNAAGIFLRHFGQGALTAASQVQGVALTSEGLWVSDKESERVYLFSRAGVLIKSIGGADSVVGEISRTRGLAADRLGALYVVEPNRDRAQKFDPKGKGLLAFASKTGLSHADKLAKRYLTHPIDAALSPDGSLWITDAGRDRIVRYALPFPGGYGVAALSAGGAAASSASVEPAVRVVDHTDGAKVERDDGVGVSVPKGALSADLEITVDKGDENQDKEQKTAKRREMKITAVSEEVQYGPEGTTFNTPVTLTVPYDANLIAAQGIKEDDLKIYYWNPGLKDWQAMPSTVDKLNKTVNAQTNHFSAYQVQGPGGGIGVAAAAVDEFGLRDVYAFPNPSRSGAPVIFRIQPGLADSIEVRVYDVSGRKVHSSSDFRFSVLDDGNGKGAQNTYDHAWDVSGVGSGVYTYVITAGRAGQTPIVKSGKAGVIK